MKLSPPRFRKTGKEDRPFGRSAHPNNYFTILFLAAVTLISHCDGTSIIVLTDLHTKIIVAADSKVYGSDELLCKLFKTGTVYWAISGQIGAFGPYNLPVIISRCQREGRNVRGTFANFERAILAPLHWEMMREERTKPKVFIDRYRFEVLDIAFFGFESGSASIAHAQYTWEKTDDAKTKRIVPHPEPLIVGACPGNSVACGALIGVKTKAMEYFAVHPSWPNNLVDAAIQGIKASIGESHEAVGPPIRVWTIMTDNRATAYQNGCEINSGPPPPAKY